MSTRVRLDPAVELDTIHAHPGAANALLAISAAILLADSPVADRFFAMFG